MRIFDPHIHMTSRTTDDYAALYAGGVRALVEPAFWLGQPRTSVGSFIDYFDSLLGWERFRASQFGIRHHATIALNPKEANDPRCVPVLDEIPRYLAKEGVVAVGEIGFDSMTPAEDEAFIRQLDLAHEFSLPALVHTPHREKLLGTRRTLDIIRESALAPSMVVVDHLNETNVGMVKDAGAWMGFSIYPDTKMDEKRLVAILHEYGTDKVLVNSAADWGKSDPLKTVSTAKAMLTGGFTADDVERVLWQNPVDFYGQSGQLILDPIPGFDGAELGGAGATFEGNSLLRGVRA
ncbi:TatD family hydrolase [Arthrobacter sp. zg-Y820]|uniref:TatD family hydrolase n=1 Tax=unclassified Arthrobacter TaxID=235627 RepID=UPI001E61B807|nr:MULTISPECIES: TatD family hydrolase [unclassified Arthrobacter]MCC9196904.1 TatD family hydrolase [Arthrobacter sp. zg-Y820]MDK1279768.1 TatD family hydrolase [Arthrobacter sp. zg.Y820]MDK1361901.1 TatD family hydrolase [Arthrobacter sp. zg-Y1219]WIB10978.1 TatD family hydrolase [Arthrobacter sp. zg-Y820]